MRTFAILIALALALPLVGANPGDDHRPGNGDDDTVGGGAVPDMPDASIFGLCVAYEHNEKGRENGNAGNAGPFVWLEQQAEDNDMTVEEFCHDRAPGSPP